MALFPRTRTAYTYIVSLRRFLVQWNIIVPPFGPAALQTLALPSDTSVIVDI